MAKAWIILVLAVAGCASSHPLEELSAKETKDTRFLYIHQNSSHTQSPVLADGLTPQTVTCPDHVSECPDGNTCCKFKDLPGYGCCKGLRMVCCDDKEHCCREGTTCDLHNGNCKGKASSVSFLAMLTSPPTSPPLRSILCPDGSTACADGSTCCPLLVNGTYGCCPKPEAMCCTDKISCCPHGYTCGPDKCKRNNFGLPAIAKTPLVPHANLKPVCLDGRTSCGVNDTCCMHLDKSWGCCPAHNAVCCSDGHHCCPENHTCDLNDFTCKPKTPATMKIQNHQLPLLKNYPGGKYNDGSTDKDAL